MPQNDEFIDKLARDMARDNYQQVQVNVKMINELALSVTKLETAVSLHVKACDEMREDERERRQDIQRAMLEWDRKWNGLIWSALIGALLIAGSLLGIIYTLHFGGK